MKPPMPIPTPIHRQGAMMMLKIVLAWMPFDSFSQEEFWRSYNGLVRGQREAAIRKGMAQYRFALLHRAGEDADWIASNNRYGI